MGTPGLQSPSCLYLHYSSTYLPTYLFIVYKLQISVPSPDLSCQTRIHLSHCPLATSTWTCRAPNTPPRPPPLLPARPISADDSPAPSSHFLKLNALETPWTHVCLTPTSDLSPHRPGSPEEASLSASPPRPPPGHLPPGLPPPPRSCRLRDGQFPASPPEGASEHPPAPGAPLSRAP